MELVRNFDWVESSRPYIQGEYARQFSHTIKHGPIFDLTARLNPELDGNGVQVGRFDDAWPNFAMHRDSRNEATSRAMQFGKYTGGEVFLQSENAADPPETFNIQEEFYEFEGRRPHWMNPVTSGRRSWCQPSCQRTCVVRSPRTMR